jgi:short-subunit dehydrogenase
MACYCAMNRLARQNIGKRETTMQINETVAVVTGGASGLGEATVRAFVSGGAKV